MRHFATNNFIATFSNSFSLLKRSVSSKMFNRPYIEFKVNKKRDKKILENKIWPQLSVTEHSIERT